MSAFFMQQIVAINYINFYISNKLMIMNPKEIWVSPTIMSKILGINRSTVYRRFKTKKNKLKSRNNPIDGHIEVKVTPKYKAKYLKLLTKE